MITSDTGFKARIDRHDDGDEEDLGEEAAMNIACPDCGLVSPMDHKFCGYCGASLELANTGLAPANASYPGMDETPTSMEKEWASALTLLRLRHIVGAGQGLLLLAACLLFLYPVASGWWALGTFLVLCVFQLLISLAIRRVGGRGAMEAISEIEQEGPFR